MRTKFSIAAICLAGLVATGCNSESENKKPPQADIQYKTMVVGVRDMTLSRTYTARLAGRQIVEVRPQISGNITQICIKEGNRVRKNQPLFVIDQVPYQAALEMAVAARKSAEAKLATARMNYKSEVDLKAQNVVSDFSVETSLHALREAEAMVEQARAQERNARNSLSYTIVRSPVDGVASMIPWHVGALVSSNISEPLVTVADDHVVHAYFSINENQVIELIRQYGSIERFGASFANPNRLLHDGGSATVVLPTRMPRSIVIPQEATYELQNRIFVYKVVKGKTKAQEVEVSRQNNGREYIVVKGLEVGDTIVAEGAGLLKEGVEI